jgi:hypothetical protein
MPESNVIHVWPRTLPPGLDGLYQTMAALLGMSDVSPVADLAEIGRISGGEGHNASVVIVLDAVAVADANFAAGFNAAIHDLRAARHVNTVVIVGDGYLGTDSESLTSAMYGASAVSLMRSLALTRDRPSRSNVVVVPDSLMGLSGSQRGPLPQGTEVPDVAQAAAFLLGPTGAYVSGQTLFVNGGRHLFSSQTA